MMVIITIILWKVVVVVNGKAPFIILITGEYEYPASVRGFVV